MRIYSARFVKTLRSLKLTPLASFLSLTLVFNPFPTLSHPAELAVLDAEGDRAAEARTLHDVLEGRMRSWERLTEEGNGSKRALDVVLQYKFPDVRDLDPQPLLLAREAAVRDGDRLAEALISILLAREYLVLSLKPAFDSPERPRDTERESYEGHRSMVWRLIPRGLLPQRRTAPTEHDALKAAKESLDRAVVLLTGPEDEILTAFLHQTLSNYWYAGHAEEALHHGDDALRLFTKHDYPFEAAKTHAIIGETYASLADHERALEHLMENLRYVPSKKLRMSRTESGISEISGCDLISVLGRSSEQCHLETLERINKSGTTQFLALTLHRLGDHYSTIGAYDQALEKYEEAVSRYLKDGREHDAANVLHNMADLRSALGQIDVALRLHRQAADIYQQFLIYDAAKEWAVIGYLENQLGQQRQGLAELVKALFVFVQIRLEADVVSDIVPVLSTIGSVLKDVGKHRLALQVYERVMALSDDLFTRSHTLLRMSDVEVRLGDKNSALHHLGVVARMLEEVRGETIKQAQQEWGSASVSHYTLAITDLGRTEIALGRFEEGIAHLEEGLRLKDYQPEISVGGRRLEIYKPDTFRQATIHYHLAIGLLATHKSVEALPHALASIRILKKFQAHAFFTGREKGAEHLGVSLEPVHRLAAALYLNLHQPDMAFSLMAGVRMQVLRAMIKRHELGFQTAVGRQLWVRRAQLLQRVSSLQIKLLQRHSTEDTESLQKELQLQEEQLSQVERTLSKEVAVFSNIFETPTITLEQVQAALNDRTAVIEYAILGDLVAFIIQKHTFSVVHLSNIGEVERAVRTFREAQDPVRGGIETYKESAQQLYRLLFKPVKTHLSPSVSNLIIVPDGILNLLPFEALVDQKNRFLLQTYIIRYLNTVRELLVPKGTLGRGLLAYGGAQFSEAAAILKTHVLGDVVAMATSRGTKGYCGGPAIAWPELRGTDKEAQDVARLFGSVARIGPKATEANFKREAVGKRYIFISSHGYFSDCELATRRTTEVEELPVTFDALAHSGLVFSGANTGGDGYEDGYLTALEVLGLNLTGVELVVLSACDTGVGELKGEEGVIGLKRSFLAAGARSLVLSLWKVPNPETRDLIVTFFKGVKRGEPKTDALRKAKLKLIRQGKTSPYYWASFVLVGQ